LNNLVRDFIKTNSAIHPNPEHIPPMSQLAATSHRSHHV
jgi:hypothetical protein